MEITHEIDLQTVDGDTTKISPENIMVQLYFDLAFEGLEDKYMQ